MAGCIVPGMQIWDGSDPYMGACMRLYVITAGRQTWRWTSSCDEITTERQRECQIEIAWAFEISKLNDISPSAQTHL